MDEDPFKNREIREMFQDVKNDLGEIKVQTRMTNGRVTRLEKWQSFISGGMAVIVVIVVPLLGWALYVLANIQPQIHSAVDDALSAYNITNTK